MNLLDRLPCDIAAKVYRFMTPPSYLAELKADCANVCNMCLHAYNEKSGCYVHLRNTATSSEFWFLGHCICPDQAEYRICSACLNSRTIRKFPNGTQVNVREFLHYGTFTGQFYIVNTKDSFRCSYWDCEFKPLLGSRAPRAFNAFNIGQIYGRFATWPERLKCLHMFKQFFQDYCNELDMQRQKRARVEMLCQ